MGWKLKGGKASTPNKPSNGDAASVRGRKVSLENRPFDEDIGEQFKMNVHRPPKGVQNWFDAWPSDGEDEEDEEEDDDSDDDYVEKGSGKGGIDTVRKFTPAIVPTLPQVDSPKSTLKPTSVYVPRRSPLDGVHEDRGRPARPQHTAHTAGQRRVVQLSRPRSVDSVRSVAASERSKPLSPMKARFDSPDIDHVTLRERARSALSDYSIDASLPDIRASLMVDDHCSVILGSASTVDLSRLPSIKPLQVATSPLSTNSPILKPSYSLDNFSWSSSAFSELQNELLSPDQSVGSPDGTTLASSDEFAPRETARKFSHDAGSLREMRLERATSRLPILSTTGPVNVVVCNDAVSIPIRKTSVSTAPTLDSGHVVVVTDEEMALLKTMRQKTSRVTSPSWSETIGKFPAPAEQSPVTSPMRTPPLLPKNKHRYSKSRQDSAMPSAKQSPTVQVETCRESEAPNKTNTEECSQGESYLESESSASSVVSVDEIRSTTPVRSTFLESHSPPARDRDDPLRASVQRISDARKRASTWQPEVGDETNHPPAPAKPQTISPEAQRRLETFIATKGAPPPLNAWIKATTMRRENTLVPPVTDAQEMPMPRVTPRAPRDMQQVSPSRLQTPHREPKLPTPSLGTQGHSTPDLLAQDPPRRRRDPMTRFSKVPMPNPLKSHPIEPSLPPASLHSRKSSRSTQAPEVISATVRRLPWDTGPVIPPSSVTTSRNMSNASQSTLSSYDSCEQFPSEVPAYSSHGTNDWTHMTDPRRSKSRGPRLTRRPGEQAGKPDGGGKLRTVEVGVKKTDGRRRGLSAADDGGLAPGLDPWHVLAGRAPAVRASKSHGGGLSGIYQQQGKGTRV
ncbi:hypothetical protein TI39_contig511g00007 [Zymoseptoria brevis]|uniref:Uncharacterized protein n=1 Tax=Zymoseptoria brevis TaxID=1047168 RepID=A0A0F4GIV7_9PEZI|nr:hypothetical protein TI39_contig511g00007 [Zymoseptoria brevis]